LDLSSVHQQQNNNKKKKQKKKKKKKKKLKKQPMFMLSPRLAALATPRGQTYQRPASRLLFTPRKPTTARHRFEKTKKRAESATNHFPYSIHELFAKKLPKIEKKTNYGTRVMMDEL